MVFVASAIPYNGKTAVEVFTDDEEGEFLENLIFSDDGSSVSMSIETITNIVFTGASEDQMERVLPQLVNQASKPFYEPVITTQRNFGSVPKAYIETTLDRVISLKAQRHVQRMTGIDEVVTLAYGHVPLETAPEKLANALIQVAASGEKVAH